MFQAAENLVSASTQNKLRQNNNDRNSAKSLSLSKSATITSKYKNKYQKKTTFDIS